MAIQGRRRTESEKRLLHSFCQSEQQLLGIEKWIKGSNKLADLPTKLQIDKSLDRITIEKPRPVSSAYYLLYEWKKKGERWESLYDALSSTIQIDFKHFIRVILGKDSKNDEKEIRKRIKEVGNVTLEEVSDRMLVRLAECIGNEYWYLGLRLGITEAAMEKMEFDCKDCDECIRKILKIWQIGTGGFKELIRAMTLSSCNWSRIRPILKGTQNESTDASNEQSDSEEGYVEQDNNEDHMSNIMALYRRSHRSMEKWRKLIKHTVQRVTKSATDTKGLFTMRAFIWFHLPTYIYVLMSYIVAYVFESYRHWTLYYYIKLVLWFVLINVLVTYICTIIYTSIYFIT